MDSLHFTVSKCVHFDVGNMYSKQSSSVITMTVYHMRKNVFLTFFRKNGKINLLPI